MPKEGLIISLLKSKRSLAELFNNNLDNDTISEIKKIVNKLRDILTKNLEKKNLSELEKEGIDEYLFELVRILDKKEKYRYHDRDDLITME